MLLASIPGNMQAWIHFSGKGVPVRLSWTNIQAVSAISKSHFFYLSFLSISRIDRCSQKHLNSFFESMQMKPLHQRCIRLYTCRSNLCPLPIKSSLLNSLETIFKKSPFTGWFLCGIRDSNPRTPARQDLKSCAFGQLG